MNEIFGTQSDKPFDTESTQFTDTMGWGSVADILDQPDEEPSHTHDEALRPVASTLRTEENTQNEPTVLDNLIDNGDLTYSA